MKFVLPMYFLISQAVKLLVLPRFLSRPLTFGRPFFITGVGTRRYAGESVCVSGSFHSEWENSTVQQILSEVGQEMREVEKEIRVVKRKAEAIEVCLGFGEESEDISKLVTAYRASGLTFPQLYVEKESLRKKEKSLRKKEESLQEDGNRKMLWFFIHLLAA